MGNGTTSAPFSPHNHGWGGRGLTTGGSSTASSSSSPPGVAGVTCPDATALPSRRGGGRLRRWSEEGGVWDTIVEVLRDAAYQQGSLSLDVVSVDSSLVETKKGERMQPTTGTRSGEE